MNKAEAKRMLETARAYVGDNLYSPPDFDDVELEQFLRKYLWVIYVSGFRNATAAKHIDTIEAAFHGLELDKIAAMKSINADRLPIRNQRRADAFLRGCKLIHAEGWQTFQERVKKHGMNALEGLPWMGSAAKKQLAKITGIEDTEKPDTWIVQCADKCSATVDELITFLSKEYGLKRHQVDSYLWQYCRANGVP